MRWLVVRDGETFGPLEDAQVKEWIQQGGLLRGSIREEAGQLWMPLNASPFATLLPAGERSIGGRVLVALGAALFGAAAGGVWFGVIGAVGGGAALSVLGLTLDQTKVGPSRILRVAGIAALVGLVIAGAIYKSGVGSIDSAERRINESAAILDEIRDVPRSQVRVECSGSPNGVLCDIVHTSGESKVKACWDVKLSCKNGTVTTGEACASVEPRGRTSSLLTEDQFTSFHACDLVTGAEVKNIELAQTL